MVVDNGIFVSICGYFKKYRWIIDFLRGYGLFFWCWRVVCFFNVRVFDSYKECKLGEMGYDRDEKDFIVGSYYRDVIVFSIVNGIYWVWSEFKYVVELYLVSLYYYFKVGDLIYIVRLVFMR